MTDLQEKAMQMALEALDCLPWQASPIAIEATKALRQALAHQETTVENNSQNWKGMDGAVAWHLIDRHADNWADVGKMMDEWLKANQALSQQDKECIYPECETGIGCDGPCGAAVKQEPVGWAFREHLEALGVDFSKPRAEENGEQVGPESPLGKRPHTSTPLYAQPVDTVNTSQECVDETAKRGHEPVVGTKTWVEDGKVFTQNLYASDIYITPPKREWVGLTDEERKDIELGVEVFDMSVEDILKEAEAKLKEKNT